MDLIRPFGCEDIAARIVEPFTAYGLKDIGIDFELP
jgi:hypothetical protein